MKNKLYFIFLSFSSYVLGNDTIVANNNTFRENFQYNYKSNEYNYETIIEKNNLNWFQKILEAIRFFLRELFNFGSIDKPLSSLEIILKILAIVIIAFAVYLIIRIIVKKEVGWIFGKKNKPILESEFNEEDIHKINFEKIIASAKNQNNYRLSIRYYFLWLLKSLSDKSIIKWDIEKTNSDYAQEIKDKVLYKDFNYLSYIYNYSWYGEFSINEEDFIKIERIFLKTILGKNE